MREQQDIERTMSVYGDTVWRVCSLYFRGRADAQDMFQDTFLKYSLHEQDFNGEEHRKAWLIRVATNICKDSLKAMYRKNQPLDERMAESAVDESALNSSAQTEVIDAMRSLDDNIRESVYLFLYEGYTAPEIAEMLDAPVNTVYSWIARGKQQLREVLS